jgi:hypothetical protein
VANSLTPKPAVDNRRVWTFSAGKFEVQADGSWLETKNDGKRFEFDETKRTPELIELSSKTQNVMIRLYKETSDIQRNNGHFKRFYSGGWNG